MKLKVKILACFLLLAHSYSYGQIGTYNYKRALKGISEQWHSMTLPNEIFGKISQNLNDIRIFGITAGNDTVEAPYLLRLATGKISDEQVAFTTLNVSQNDKGYYCTFEIPLTEPINQIKMDFEQQNFDWRIKLEGSQNQDEWFTILDDYRIISIKNNLTDFKFTKLTFPNSKYRFFRLFIGNKEKPKLTVASITRNEITEGTYRNYPVRKFGIKENAQIKQTEIDIELQLPVPVSRLKINVRDTFDYYRPVTIKYLTDSFKTEQGWKYNYNTLTSGILNSIEENEFEFSSTTTQRLKIYIHNHDNSPLTIDTIQVKGYIHELVARFTEQATYFLTYGNKNAARPNYDIDHFPEKIPITLTAIELGNEQTIEKENQQTKVPLFQNKAWLWVIMTVIILLLGWFSVKMIRKN